MPIFSNRTPKGLNEYDTFIISYLMKTEKERMNWFTRERAVLILLQGSPTSWSFK